MSLNIFECSHYSHYCFLRPACRKHSLVLDGWWEPQIGQLFIWLMLFFSCFTFRVKDIQSVYLDSTFYDPRYYQIPTRVSFSKWEQDSNCRNIEVLSAKAPTEVVKKIERFWDAVAFTPGV